MEAEETVSAAAAAAPSAARLSVTLHAHEPPAGAGAAGGAGGKRRLPPLEVFGPTDGLSPTLRASSVGSGSASPSIPSDPGELRAAYLRLLKEHGDLREHAHNLEAQVGVYRSPRMAGIAAAHGPLARKVSKLDSGAVVRLTEAELASMRQVFALFDPHGSGTISAGELQDLHRKLGEPLTDAEAEEMVREIGQGARSISFADFVAYWDGVHPTQRPPASGGPDSEPWSLDDARDKKRRWHQARFKFLKAKVYNPVVGRIYTVPEGVCPSLEYRVRFFYDDGDSGERVQISAWHDVPYKNVDGSYNMIVEIPKWSRRKFEIATGEPFNPVKQDVKNGTLREYAYGDMLYNYGCLPQTWEDPAVVHPATQAGGDNDPLDIVDIGSKMWSVGSIVRVKVLGVLAMIDAGETDWKLIAINCEDPLAELLNDVDDIAVHMPGAVEALHRWLKYYKSPVLNTFGFDGRPQNREFAEALVEETHEQWRHLVEARGKGPVLAPTAGHH